MWREQEEGDDTNDGWEAVRLGDALNQDNRIEDNRILGHSRGGGDPARGVSINPGECR